MVIRCLPGVLRLAPTPCGRSASLRRPTIWLLLWWRRVFRPGVEVDIANIGGCGRENRGPRNFFSFVLDCDGVGSRRQIAKDIRTAGSSLHFLVELLQSYDDVGQRNRL